MNKLREVYRDDLPGRFNEMEMLDRHFSRILNIFNGEILPSYEIYNEGGIESLIKSINEIKEKK